jgi:hypothetical protein
LKPKSSKVIKDLQAEKLKCWQALKDADSLVNLVRYKQSAAAMKLAHLKENCNEEAKILSSKNLGQFYKHINSRLSHKNGIAPLKGPDGHFIFTDAEKAVLLNSAFAKHRTTDNGHLPNVESYNHRSTFCSVAWDPGVIHSKLITLKVGSAPGPDNIPTIFFKNLASVLAYTL